MGAEGANRCVGVGNLGMAIKIDTTRAEVRSESASCEPGMIIRVRTHRESDKLHRRIKANIEQFERVDDLDDYMDRESLALDALHIFDPAVCADLIETYEFHRAWIDPRVKEPRNAGTQETQNGKEGKDDVQVGYW